MAIYFISRHPGAREWAARRGIEATFLEHLDPAMLAAGDVVMGSLPIRLAAAVCARGGRLFCLDLDVPAELRGTPLSAEQMEAHGACLVAYDVTRLEGPPPGQHT